MGQISVIRKRNTHMEILNTPTIEKPKDKLSLRTNSLQNQSEKKEEEEYKTLAQIQWVCFLMMLLTMLITMATEVSTAQVLMLCTGFAAIVGIICHVNPKTQRNQS